MKRKLPLPFHPAGRLTFIRRIKDKLFLQQGSWCAFEKKRLFYFQSDKKERLFYQQAVENFF